MRNIVIALGALIMAASPAHATGGFQCRTAQKPVIEISVGFGHTAGVGLFAQRLIVGTREIAVDAPQWWLDDSEMRLLLVDRDRNGVVAELRAERKGATYDGSLDYRGKRYWVRCHES